MIAKNRELAFAAIRSLKGGAYVTENCDVQKLIETLLDGKDEFYSIDALNTDMVSIIREITDAHGHKGVPFLDEAVKNIIRERDQLKEANQRQYEDFVRLQKALSGDLTMPGTSATLVDDAIRKLNGLEEFKKRHLSNLCRCEDCTKARDE